MNTPLKYIKLSYIVILLVVLIGSSCRKTNVDTPSFDVTIPKATFAVKEPIIFTTTGTADIVTFYSGEPGKDFKSKIVQPLDGKPQMQFTSYLEAGGQPNTMHLMVSKDFRGVLTIPNVQTATWTEITDRATFSTGTDNTPSGVVDLSDFSTDGSPVYLAYKYTAVSGTVQPTWTFKNVAIDNVQADGTVISIEKLATMKWGTISILNSAHVWNAPATTQLRIYQAPATADDSEAWCISQPLTLNRAQRSFGKSLKASPTTKLTSYTFPGFTVPGTYTVSFEAINDSKSDTKSVLKEFTITVQ